MNSIPAFIPGSAINPIIVKERGLKPNSHTFIFLNFPCHSLLMLFGDIFEKCGTTNLIKNEEVCNQYRIV